MLLHIICMHDFLSPCNLHGCNHKDGTEAHRCTVQPNGLLEVEVCLGTVGTGKCKGNHERADDGDNEGYEPFVVKKVFSSFFSLLSWCSFRSNFFIVFPFSFFIFVSCFG